MTNEDIDKLNNRKHFLFPLHLNSMITNDMTEHEVGTFFKAVMLYVTSGVIPAFQDRTFAKASFGLFREAYDREADKYIHACKVKQEKALQREKKKKDEADKLKHPEYG